MNIPPNTMDGFRFLEVGDLDSDEGDAKTSNVKINALDSDKSNVTSGIQLLGSVLDIQNRNSEQCHDLENPPSSTLNMIQYTKSLTKSEEQSAENDREKQDASEIQIKEIEQEAEEPKPELLEVEASPETSQAKQQELFLEESDKDSTFKESELQPTRNCHELENSPNSMLDMIEYTKTLTRSGENLTKTDEDQAEQQNDPEIQNTEIEHEDEEPKAELLEVDEEKVIVKESEIDTKELEHDEVKEKESIKGCPCSCHPKDDIVDPGEAQHEDNELHLPFTTKLKEVAFGFAPESEIKDLEKKKRPSGSLKEAKELIKEIEHDLETINLVTIDRKTTFYDDNLEMISFAPEDKPTTSDEQEATEGLYTMTGAIYNSSMDLKCGDENLDDYKNESEAEDALIVGPSASHITETKNVSSSEPEALPKSKINVKVIARFEP